MPQQNSASTSIKNLNANDLLIQFEKLVSIEKKTTAEILEYLKEIDRRKLYLHMGHTSLFSYLTKGLKYSESSALRRINAARILNAAPEIKKHLESGELNLMQVSFVAQAIKQKETELKNQTVENKEPSEAVINKTELLMKVKNLDIVTTQKVIAKSLNLKVSTFEKKKVQKDESVRLEITLTKEQIEILDRVKDLISHSNPNPSISDLIEYLANEFIKRKDPLVEKATQMKKEQSTPNLVVKKPANPVAKKSQISSHQISFQRPYLSLAQKRQIHQRDLHCQWVDPVTKKKCQSTFQNQIDHIVAICNGGTNDSDNLQILCSTHNQLKYRLGL